MLKVADGNDRALFCRSVSLGMFPKSRDLAWRGRLNEGGFVQAPHFLAFPCTHCEKVGANFGRASNLPEPALAVRMPPLTRISPRRKTVSGTPRTARPE